MSDSQLHPGGSRWHAAAAAAWLSWALVSAAAIGWLAVQVERFRAPLIVFPLSLGLVSALLLIAGLRVCSLAHAPTVYAGTVLAIALVVGGQHYWSYRAACEARAGALADLQKARRAFPNLADQLAAPPPAGVIEYLQAEVARGRMLFGRRLRGPLLWSWWILESVLVLVAAALPIRWALKQPYCALPKLAP